ncbi:hypothetical protein DFH28DRAFT_897204 [Melampsora americana]|nr:hypothetical protein DFH28DRAFT_897204 [Melampsora americana]
MSNTSSIPPSGSPANSQIIDVFELPDQGVGDNQRAICLHQNPLHRRGTPARILFDQCNQMTIEVRFKIYTQQKVNMKNPGQSTDKVVAGKKQSKPAVLNLIDSKVINKKYFDIKTCPFGMSLKEFKALVANACENYEGGMKKIIMNPHFKPELTWKAAVGRSKQNLDDSTQWQAFATALEKSKTKKGLVVIENENIEVECNDGNKMLIASVNGAEGDLDGSKVPDKDAELHVLANTIFSQAGIGGYAGGDGTVLTVPWDPTFRYRMTYRAAWIWAKGVMANIATQYIPPNTREFNLEVKKSEWTHPDMGVDHRVQMRLQGHPRRLQDAIQPQATSTSSSNIIANSSVQPEVNTDAKKMLNKHYIDLTEPFDCKPDLSKFTDTKPEIKKVKMDSGPGSSRENPQCVSSDSETDGIDSEIDFSQGKVTLEIPSVHTVAMEMFLADCDLPYEDVKTRAILKDAGIISWTDLVPSVQMTKSTLTSKGIDWEVASRLMDAAQELYNADCKCPLCFMLFSSAPCGSN